MPRPPAAQPVRPFGQPPPIADPALDRAVRRARIRIVPFLILMYMLAYLDRVNVSFAKPSFQASTGVTDVAFAFGAGIFFLTYALFELPSNLMLHRVGARRWLARIMITWGLVAASTAAVHGDRGFWLVRLVLGMTEAGLFPGAVFYLTQWFPSKERGKILALFYFGSPLALIFGGPVSGLLLDLDGTFGLRGWQLMFLLEGLLTVLVGLLALLVLKDRLQDATWLDAQERDSLAATLAAEAAVRTREGTSRIGVAIRDPRLFHAAAIYFLIQITGLGVAFYLPTQVGALLGVHVGLRVGFVSAIPWVFALLAGFFYPDRMVRAGKARLGLLISLAAIGCGLVASANLAAAGAIAALCFVTMGIMTAQPIFWTFPSRHLEGAAAAGGFAIINAIGGLGGFVAPNLRTAAVAHSGSAAAGLYAIAAAAFIGMALALFLPRSSTLPRATARS